MKNIVSDCCADGRFVYQSLEQLTDYLVEHLFNESWPKAQARAFLKKTTAGAALLKQKI